MSKIPMDLKVEGQKASPGLSIIIPIYNEAENLPLLSEELKQSLEAAVPRYEVIFVDDGSNDGSPALLQQLVALGRGKIRAIRFRRNLGKGAAYAAGFQQARGRLIATMDGDLQDDPRDLLRLKARLEEGYDCVVGWRQHRRGSWAKRLLSQVFNLLARRATGVEIRDFNSPLKIFRAEVAKGLEVRGDLFRFIPLLVARQGFKVANLPVVNRPRRHGRSKFGWRKFLGAPLDFLTVIYLTRYFGQPFHLFGGLGATFFLAGVLIEVYLTLRRILEGVHYGEHLPLFMLGILLILFGIQLISIGLTAEVLTRFTTRHEPPSEVEAIWE